MVRLLREDGCRRHSPDSVHRYYAALGYRHGAWAIDMRFTGADNALSGQSPAPVQELAVHRALIFTSPQSNDNRLVFTTLNAHYAASDTLALQGGLYLRGFRQQVVNGHTTGYTACASAARAGDLCQDQAATPLTGTGGGVLPDITNGGATYRQPCCAVQYLCGGAPAALGQRIRRLTGRSSTRRFD